MLSFSGGTRGYNSTTSDSSTILLTVTDTVTDTVKVTFKVKVTARVSYQACSQDMQQLQHPQHYQSPLPQCHGTVGAPDGYPRPETFSNLL